MRVLLPTYGSRGDVEPMVALAVELRAFGADVRMCAPPDEEFAELLARAGVPLVPFDRPWRSWERPPTADERRQRVTDFITAQYDTVAAAAAGCDVIVATAMSQFVGSSVAEQLGTAYRCVLFCPDVLDGLDEQGFDALFGASINTHRAAIGLPPVDDVGEFMFTRRPLLAADPALAPWREPRRFDPRQTGAWFLPDERPLPGDLLTFLDAGGPPVYLGFGSMRTVAAGSVRAAVDAIRAHHRRVLIGRGWAGLGLVDDRDDCFVIGEINQQELFRRVAAVVHHGGAGTTTTAARAGRPAGGRAARGRPALLGAPGGRARHRCRPRRSDPHRPVAERPPQDGADGCHPGAGVRARRFHRDRGGQERREAGDGQRRGLTALSPGLDVTGTGPRPSESTSAKSAAARHRTGLPRREP